MLGNGEDGEPFLGHAGISCDLFESTTWFSNVTGLDYSIPTCGISISSWHSVLC